MTEQLAVLCVDDELSVLAGLSRQLRRHFAISIAGSGPEALDLIRKADQQYAVIVSDMMMPGMSGAEFLRRSREITPDSVRIVLTGQASVDLAAAAVNEGAISRYLTKPCSADLMLATLLECTDTFRRTTLERSILEQTLNAAVDALGQTLALVAPEVFARSIRVGSLVRAMLSLVPTADAWAIEVAVPLSQLGALSLPPNVLQSWVAGKAIPGGSDDLVAEIPSISAAIVRTIPRLDVVSTIIEDLHQRHAHQAQRHIGADLIRLGFQIDALETRGETRSLAVAQLAAHADRRQRPYLDALGEQPPVAEVETRLAELQLGMVLSRDVVCDDGSLIVGRGAPVNPALVVRLKNFRNCGLIPPIVYVEDRS